MVQWTSLLTLVSSGTHRTLAKYTSQSTVHLVPGLMYSVKREMPVPGPQCRAQHLATSAREETDEEDKDEEDENEDEDEEYEDGEDDGDGEDGEDDDDDEHLLTQRSSTAYCTATFAFTS